MDSLSFDPTWIFVSLIPGGIGFVLFVYGKKQQRWPHIVAGIVMMVYPYFTPTITTMTLAGVLICAALWYVVRLGY